MKNIVFTFLLVSFVGLVACDLIPSKIRKAELASKRYAWELDAEDGDVEATYKAAEASCCGDETLNDEIKSLNLFCKAAKYGHKASMIELGHKFQNKNTSKSTIIPYDRPLAFTFYSIAEQNGSDDAEYFRTKLLAELSEDEFAKATRLIDSYPVVPCEITR